MCKPTNNLPIKCTSSWANIPQSHFSRKDTPFGEKSILQQSLLPKRYPIRGEKHPPAVTPPEKIPHSGRNATLSSHSSPKDTPFGEKCSPKQTFLPKRYLIRGEKQPSAVTPPQKIPHSGRKVAHSSHSSRKDTPFGEKSSPQQSLLPKRYPIRGEKHPPAVIPPKKIPHSGTEATARHHI